jgi:divalent metal cation (Fe/Co/Zn/Cd) transporter
VEKLFGFFKVYREEVMTIGFLIVLFGLFIGTEAINNKIISCLIVYGISPFGLLLLLFGYEIEYTKNPKASLRISVIFIMIIWCICKFWFSSTGQYSRLLWSIIFYIVCLIQAKFIRNQRK